MFIFPKNNWKGKKTLCCKNNYFFIKKCVCVYVTWVIYWHINVLMYLTWEQHLKILKTKLSRGIGLLAKARYYLTPNLLRTLYYAIFDSYLRYKCQIWSQQKSQNITDILDLQQKALRIMNFKSKFTSWKPLFKKLNILTFPDMVRSEHCLLVLRKINQILPTNLMNNFLFTENQHNHNTRTTNNWNLTFPQVNTTSYGLNSVTYKIAKDWNSIQNEIDFNFTENHLSQIKFLKAFQKSIFSDWNCIKTLMPARSFWQVLILGNI